MGRATVFAGKVAKAIGIQSRGARISVTRMLGKIMWPALAAFLSALIAGSLKAYQNYVERQWIEENVVFQSTAYATFGTCLGFLIVFRTSQSYSRFWDGIEEVHAITGHWFNAASNLICFGRMSKGDEQQVRTMRNLIVRMFSLLNCLILHELAAEEVTSQADLGYPVIDILGIEDSSLQSILNPRAHSKVEQAVQMINKVIMEEMKAGVIAVPPPILSRVFQEIGGGMLRLHAATKLYTVDFPAPYIIALKFMLLIHVFLTPVAVIVWAETIAFSAGFSFILVLSMFGLMSLAGELDTPFQNSGFGFDKHLVQIRLNQALVTILVEEEENPVPTLSPQANKIDQSFLNALRSEMTSKGQNFHRDFALETTDL